MNQTWIKFLPEVVKTRLDGRVNLQRIISNTGWLFFDNMLRMGVGFLVGVWVARYLGPERFGLLSYAGAFVAIFSALATLGLDGIVVRDILREPFRHDEILGTAFALKFLGAILTLMMTLGGIMILRPQDTLMHCLIGITATGTVFQAFDTIDFWFQSKVQSKYPVNAKNFAFLLICMIKMYLVYLGASVISFAVAGVAEIVLASGGLWIVYRMHGGCIKRWKVSAILAKRLLSHSWPLIFSSTFVFVNMLIDKIMLGEMAGNGEVGLFSAAARLSEIWYFIPVVLGASVVPMLIEEWTISKLNYYETLQRVYNLMTLIALSLAIPVAFLSRTIIDHVFGSSYSAAAHILSVHIWTGLFVFHVSIRTRSLIIEEKQKFVAVLSFFTMLFNIIFNLILIPLYGGVGSAYASLFSWILCVLLVPYLSRETSGSVGMFLKSFCFNNRKSGLI